jgi:hypothetical protein
MVEQAKGARGKSENIEVMLKRNRRGRGERRMKVVISRAEDIKGIRRSDIEGRDAWLEV